MLLFLFVNKKSLLVNNSLMVCCILIMELYALVYNVGVKQFEKTLFLTSLNSINEKCMSFTALCKVASAFLY